jgi:hypothetical protein
MPFLSGVIIPLGPAAVKFMKPEKAWTSPERLSGGVKKLFSL